MRTILALAAIATLTLGASGRSADPPAVPASVDADTTVVVLQQGDWRLDAAHGCLKQMLTSEWEGGRTDLESILGATGFSLTRVTVRSLERETRRIRFGFEFANREQVKTLYWEASCRVDELTGTELARRQP